jgi:hypothetical protein
VRRVRSGTACAHGADGAAYRWPPGLLVIGAIRSTMEEAGRRRVGTADRARHAALIESLA